jgi:hypothetical protein
MTLGRCFLYDPNLFQQIAIFVMISLIEFWYVFLLLIPVLYVIHQLALEQGHFKKVSTLKFYTTGIVGFIVVWIAACTVVSLIYINSCN